MGKELFCTAVVFWSSIQTLRGTRATLAQNPPKEQRGLYH